MPRWHHFHCRVPFVRLHILRLQNMRELDVVDFVSKRRNEVWTLPPFADAELCQLVEHREVWVECFALFAQAIVALAESWNPTDE